MRKYIGWLLVSALLAFAALAPLKPANALQKKDEDTSGWTTEFNEDKKDLGPTGNNPYFPLEPGHFVILEGNGEVVTETVLSETKKVDGVECRVMK